MTGGLAGDRDDDAVLRVAVAPGATATEGLAEGVEERLQRLSSRCLGGTPIAVTLLAPGERPTGRVVLVLPWVLGAGPW